MAEPQRTSRQESRDPLRLQGLSHGDRARLDLLRVVQEWTEGQEGRASGNEKNTS